MASFKPSHGQRGPPRWRLALAALLAAALLALPLRRQRAGACPVQLAGQEASGGSGNDSRGNGTSGGGGGDALGLAAADAADTARAVAAAVARTSDVWWPTAGDTVHILYTSNGHP